ncbi:NDP-hexose 2,3-dehydratase family protein [Crossiella sp. SN42]|uniref:NDP-hexose 2,3-dehydratase family protein n=1 Tax=Crossiella sp. SN42 TaxID=2944808 RepID=UPI00207C83E4|nr:NDP-hexose 2,3-dehydratase family protein [Crossiella sp. SN42]MCO1580358.1 NDP-hexose 2,3-dehydratase family protein [Crossiella sp. SN42]
MAKLGVLRYEDTVLPRRVAESALAGDGVHDSAEVAAWLAECRVRQRQRVRRIPFAELRGWGFAAGTGDLVHESGRFFSVAGLRVRTDYGPVAEWTQPIINQPEVGILGIAVREFGGVLHCLVQAKTEPGNVNGVQLAPTVQATRSNYTGVHRGRAVPYLDCFRQPDPRRVVADVLQSEQGAWFYRKRNRNIVVEVGPEVVPGPDFHWLTLGQLHQLLPVPNLVGMDTRTVLSCLPWPAGDGGSLHSTAEILSWLTTRQTEHELRTDLLPLQDIQGWRRTPVAIEHEHGRFFSVVAVDVRARGREVGGWTQPLIRPHGVGVHALLVARFGGVPHALVNARVEPGYLGVVELAPTVQCTPENYAHLPPQDQPPFLDLVTRRRPEQVLFDAVLSEEGGRFQHAQGRYLIIDATGLPVHNGPGFRWMTMPQLTGLLQHSHYLNVQARTLVTCLRSLR